MRAPSSPWFEHCALGAILLVAAALRFAAANNDLWLDEIWSLNLIRDLPSPWAVLSVRHDNNHWLNSLYLYALGDSAGPMAYRLLSILSGIATVALLWLIARPAGRWSALAAAAIAAISYPLVLYASEARGYAPALACALLSFWLLRRWLGDPRPTLLAAFWLAVALGFAANLTFIYAYLALWLYSAAAIRTTGGWRDAARRLAWLHAVPTALLATIAWYAVRGMAIGGADVHPVPEVLLETLEMLLGAPASGAGQLLVLASLLAVTIYGFAAIWRENRLDATFFGVVALAPAVVITLRQPAFLQFRYFLVCFPFAYLALARGLAAIGGGGRHALAAGLLLLFAAGQTVRLVPLLRDGRGHNCAAVQAMAAATGAANITVGSDHDFRNPVVLQYYARCLPPGKTLHYIAQDDAEVPDWLLLHSQDMDYRPPPRVSRGQSPYRLYEFFPFGGVSGWNWALYRRQ